MAGQTMLLRLESNPTTGFCWALDQEQELFSVRTCYVTEQISELLCGSGGWQSFILTPKQAGAARLCFAYARPLEPSDTDPQFSCVVAVSEDLKITVIEPGAQQDFASAMRIY